MLTIFKSTLPKTPAFKESNEILSERFKKIHQTFMQLEKMVVPILQDETPGDECESCLLRVTYIKLNDRIITGYGKAFESESDAIVNKEDSNLELSNLEQLISATFYIKNFLISIEKNFELVKIPNAFLNQNFTSYKVQAAIEKLKSFSTQYKNTLSQLQADIFNYLCNLTYAKTNNKYSKASSDQDANIFYWNFNVTEEAKQIVKLSHLTIVAPIIDSKVLNDNKFTM